MFKKLIEKKVFSIEGVAYCLDELSKMADFKQVINIVLNGVPEWSVNPDIVRKFIFNEYNHKKIIIANICYNYVHNYIEVKYSYEETRWYKTENANRWDSNRNKEDEEYKFKKTNVCSLTITINYDDYCSKAEGLSKLKIDDETPVEG